MNKMNGAEYIASIFKGYGVNYIFYVEAILRKTLVELGRVGINRILTHSEKAAVYMADGYARASGRPGICMAQSVGAMNLLAGLQDAYLAHSPVISITGQKPPSWQYRNAYQEVHHFPLFDSLTKYNVRVDEFQQLPHLLRQAFREATTGKPRPVHIEVQGYDGKLTEESFGNLDINVEERYCNYPALRTLPEQELLITVSELLHSLNKPVILAGRGVLMSRAKAEVVQLAEKLDIPITTSVDGKGIVVDTHPLAVGPVGTYCRPCANEVVSLADLVFLIGTGAGDQVTKDWTLLKPGIPIIQLDIDPSEAGRNYANVIPLVGDIRASLRELIKMVNKKSNSSWVKTASSIVQNWKTKNEEIRHSNAIPIRPERICNVISRLLPDNGVLVADTGFSAIWACSIIDLLSSKQMFFRAAGSLGWAFPASIGIKCALPDRTVICFTGDGALWYHLSELETASRMGIKVIVVVNNNSILAQSNANIRKILPENVETHYNMHMFRKTNFAHIAEEMGCNGIRVDNPERIEDAINDALAAERITVVDIVTDPEAVPAYLI